MRNEGTLDRLMRVLLAEVFFIGAFFWFGGAISIVLYVFGGIMLFTAFTGFCALYKLFGINTFQKGKKINKWVVIVMVIFIAGVIGGGIYGSIFFTKKFFLEDYNKMNNFYKQTLFFTGQNKRAEAISNYDQLVVEYAVFQQKYTNYKPFVIKQDNNFDGDLVKVNGIVSGLKDSVYTGDLLLAHKSFEDIRPIFQEMLKRNNFSLLAVSLVDFHDAMEEILIPAEEKDAAKVLAIYPLVDEKLKEVEVSANDEEIQAIRRNLDDLKSLASQNKIEEMPAKGAALKSSFVKVYLSRG